MTDRNSDADKRGSSAAAVVKAASHPVQSLILDVIAGEGSATIKEISSAVERPQATVRDHVAQLCDIGIVRVVDVRKRRGVFERVYGVDPAVLSIKDKCTDQLAAGLHRPLKIQTTRLMVGGISRALSAGMLTARSDHAFSWRRSPVDEQGWRDLAVLYRRTLEEAFEITEMSAARLANTNEESIRIGSGILLFEMPPHSDS